MKLIKQINKQAIAADAVIELHDYGFTIVYREEVIEIWRD